MMLDLAAVLLSLIFQADQPATRPATVQPAATQPAATRPASTQPASTQPVEVDPMVLIADYGTKYHRPGCKLAVGNLRQIPESEARKRYSACNACIDRVVAKRSPLVNSPARSSQLPVVQDDEELNDDVGDGTGWSGEPVYSGNKTVHVRGYRRKDGTYVRPHTRRAPRR